VPVVAVAHATAPEWPQMTAFVGHRLARIEQIPYSGPVWNLTVEGSPTFQTRIGMSHNTVKGVALMRWLCKLVTPPGGIVIDPFGGSGTTGVGALAEGFRAILIEREPDYVRIARARCEHAAPARTEKVAAAWTRSPAQRAVADFD
jgi:site-specific DNA-methyltransferase (adenine-specific)